MINLRNPVYKPIVDNRDRTKVMTTLVDSLAAYEWALIEME